jgi:hypothetical protein
MINIILRGNSVRIVKASLLTHIIILNIASLGKIKRFAEIARFIAIKRRCEKRLLT